MTNYDAILVGGGHNGLVCATYLARSGKKVLLLEANAQLGGAAISREFAPGYSVSACAQWLTQLSPKVTKDLNLATHGLSYAARDLDTVALAAAGEHLVISGNAVSGAGISAADQAAYRDFHARMLKFSAVLARAFAVRAPKLVETDLTDKLNLMKLGLGLKMLGRDDMSELMRIALVNMYDIMQENFDSDLLKAALSVDSVLGAHLGPRSHNTVFNYLYRRVGDVYGFSGPAQVAGGMGGVVAALVKAAEAAGVVMRTDCKVQRINLEGGRACGVTLANEEVIAAPLIVSNADPLTTFEKLVGYPNIETGVVRRVSQIRMKSNVAKLHLALDGPPVFAGLDPSRLGQRLLIAPTMDYIERAFNASKYGEYSEAPIFDISIPTANDSTLAPAGKHVLSAIVQFAPHNLSGGWDKVKDTYKQHLIELIASYAPGLEQQIVASELLTPVDLQNEFHMTNGHWHHGELSLDQVMMMRPFPGATQYGMPVDGLYLCGAGTHPGGGVTGLPGRNAALEIIKRGATA